MAAKAGFYHGWVICGEVGIFADATSRVIAFLLAKGRKVRTA